MPDLEAQTRIDSALAGSSDIGPGQYTWRYPLVEKKRIRLGSDVQHSDWVVPEDRMISRYHANLEWDGTVLNVSRRGVSKDFPTLPQNNIWHQNQPVERCSVRPGEWFVIGQTRFTVRGDGESDQDSPVDATVVQRREALTRRELEELPFADPATFIKAMEQLPSFLKMVRDEAALFRQMLKVVRGALPRADAAAIVNIPSDSPPNELRVTLVEQNVRHTIPSLAGEFVPSRKLVRHVVRELRKSCLHVWSTSPKDLSESPAQDQSMTLGVMHQQGLTPWAICTPFQDGSQFALYVSGRLLAGNPEESAKDAAHLREYQKFIEILVGLLETSRRTLRLTRQSVVLREAWPRGIRKFLDDPDRLEVLLRPQEKDVTVLFCDLRNYSGFAEERGEKLIDAWKEIQRALDTMSGAITERDGIVAGFRGDAVLGFWGWPDSQPGHVEKAADAALRIHEKLSGWMVQQKCGLGLTHGRALAGRLGAHDLAVVDLYGPVVNLAFRLEEMTKAFGIGIVVSEDLMTQLTKLDPHGSRWRTRLLGRVRPRGMKTPLLAYELSSTAATTGLWMSEWSPNQLARWNEAIELFTQGQWKESQEQLDDLFMGDPVAQCLIRHMARTKGIPPADWDGTFTPRPAEV